MFKKSCLVALLIGICVLIIGCSTFEGFGEDVEKTGSSIQRIASGEKAQK